MGFRLTSGQISGEKNFFLNFLSAQKNRLEISKGLSGGHFYLGLHFIAQIAKNEKKELEISRKLLQKIENLCIN